MKQSYWFISGLIGFIGVAFWCCGSPKTTQHNQKDSLPAKQYVGIQTCKSCHEEIYQSYVHTGMGKSWYLPEQQPKIEKITSKTVVYDASKKFWYRPFYKNDSLYITEFRTSGKDTLYQRTEKVAYVVGSGHQSRSYIANRNGYLYEFPITWYVQKQLWDLSPGYVGNNTRFDRAIGSTCMSCHNGHSELSEGALYQYKTVALGIDCEKCHGAGSQHVAAMKSGKKTDNYIINPAKLSLDLQIDVCQQCHLQGINVVNVTQKEDFQPAHALNNHYKVFLPEYSVKEEFGIASHAERLKRSACFIQSKGTLTCTKCHNPHEVAQKQYNETCLSCHTTPKTVCSASNTQQKAKNFDCSGCHLPKSGTSDIPHVSFTDHYIRKPLDQKSITKQKQFIGLQCFNDKKVTPQERATAWLLYYEQVEAQKYCLDSVASLLGQMSVAQKIKYFFFRKDFSTLLSLTQNQSFSDAWTNYYIGEAYLQNNDANAALPYFSKANQILPKHLDFQIKLANVYLLKQQYSDAEKVLLTCKQLDFKYAGIHNNLGILYAQQKQYDKAKNAFLTELRYHPDNVNSLGGLASIYFSTQEKEQAKKYLQQLLRIDPKHAQAQQLLKQL